MRTITLLSTLLWLGWAAPSHAEHWIASSQTATAITGNVLFVPGEIRFANGQSLKLAPPESISDFRSTGTSVPAQLYRVLTPADPSLLRGNRLCSGAGRPPRPVQAIVVWQPRPIPGVMLASRGMAAYAGLARPTSDSDPGLCGTFFYDPHP